MDVDPADGGRPTCAECGRMWQVTPNFLEGVHRARAGGASIHSICWREVPGDGIGQVGVALLYFLLLSIKWLSLPLGALLLWGGIADRREGHAARQVERSTVFEAAWGVTMAATCVVGFFLARRLLRGFLYFTRGTWTSWPTLIVADRGLFDVASYENVFHVPWDCVVDASYSSDLLEEQLWINFTVVGGVQTLCVTMNGAAGNKPLWDAAVFINDHRGVPPPREETGIRDAEAAERVRKM